MVLILGLSLTLVSRFLEIGRRTPALVNIIWLISAWEPSELSGIVVANPLNPMLLRYLLGQKFINTPSVLVVPRLKFTTALAELITLK